MLKLSVGDFIDFIKNIRSWGSKMNISGNIFSCCSLDLYDEV